MSLWKYISVRSGYSFLPGAVTDQLTWEMLLVNQVLIQKTKILVWNQSLAALSVHHMCQLCYQRFVFKPRSCFFWMSTWFRSLRRDWRVGTTIDNHYHWSTDDTVVRVHWPVRWILRIMSEYLLHSLIFPPFTANIQRFWMQIKILLSSQKYLSLRSEYFSLPGANRSCMFVCYANPCYPNPY